MKKMMKRLQANTRETYWNADLLSQLSFIRKHLRFPVNKRTLAPLIAIFSSVAGLPLLLFPAISRKHQGSFPPVLGVLFCLLLLPFLAAFYRYWQSLRFTSVPALPTSTENRKRVVEFLREHQFAGSQHPEAPDVFQMLSVNLGRSENLREVVLFIADEDRILVNSHFVGSRFGMPVSSGHGRDIARMLAQFITTQNSAPVSAELRRNE